MPLDTALHIASLGALAVCVAAYIWGYVLKAAQLRWLSVLGLFATIAALLHVVLLLGEDTGLNISLPYIAVFVIIAGLCQASAALQSRKRQGDRRGEDLGPPIGHADRRAAERRAAERRAQGA